MKRLNAAIREGEYNYALCMWTRLSFSRREEYS